MPWFLRKSGDKTCVVMGTKNDPGEVVKCHADAKKAADHMRAMYKNVEHQALVDSFDALPDEFVNALAPPELTTTLSTGFFTNGTWTDLPVEWSGNTNMTIEKTRAITFTNADVRGSHIRLFFVEGERTPDGRVIDPDSVNFNRPPPWPITLQTSRAEGHAGSVICGVIDRSYRDGHILVFEGRLDLNGEGGKEAERLIREGIMQTWSPDLGDATVDVEIQYTDEDGETPQDEVAHFVKATFLGATLVSLPALASAVVELLDSSGQVLVPAPVRDVAMTEPLGVISDPSVEKQIVTRTDDTTLSTDDESLVPLDSLAACAGPDAPPKEFFTNPNLTELQRWVTITADGRIFGHTSSYDECHIGIFDRCITIRDIADCRGDEGCNFEYAMPGHTVCADGTIVGTGPLAIKGGHASPDLDYLGAMAHYDDPEASLANVVYGMDEFGCWFSGAIKPEATESHIRIIRASGVSLDARTIENKLRYLATCSVNTPGLPKVSMRLVASADGEESDIFALVGSLDAPLASDDCDCDSPNEFDVLLARIDPQPFDELESRIATDSDFDALESRLT